MYCLKIVINVSNLKAKKTTEVLAIKKSLSVYSLLLAAMLVGYKARKRFTMMLIFCMDANNMISFSQFASLPQNPVKLQSLTAFWPGRLFTTLSGISTTNS
jgi:hypothetical protein